MSGTLVLVGLGHAHLLVATRAAAFRAAGWRVVLIDPGAFWYSSIGAGLLGGHHEPDDDMIDAARFAAGTGVEHVAAKAVRLDRAARTVVLEDGGAVPYDLVSLNVGSVVEPPFPASGETVWRAKPISGLHPLRERLRADLRARDRARDGLRWVTVGGGHSACELTLNAVAVAAAMGRRMEVTLATAGDALIASEPKGARAAMARILADKGVTVRLSTTVASVADGRVHLQDGDALPFDHALLATGLSAAPLAGACGLPSDPRRGLHVTDRLHAPTDDRVFAVGDCAAIEGHDLPKVGVFGVRAAPVLAGNLLARATGGRMRRYRPQRVWFAAQNLGDGRGMASWGPVWWTGRSALGLKDWNDRRFMRRYRRHERRHRGEPSARTASAP